MEGEDTHLPMTKPETEVRRKATRKLPVVDPDAAYRPSRRPQTSACSPYPTRPVGAQYIEEGDESLALELEVSGYLGVEAEAENLSRSGSEEELIVEGEEMARKEESDVVRLMKFMMDRDSEAKTSETKERKEREKKDAELRRESEENRRTEMMELFRQLKDEESLRRREDEAQRRRDDEEERLRKMRLGTSESCSRRN